MSGPFVNINQMDNRRNNSLGSQDQATPMPRDYTGGETDFGVERIIDGHLPGTDAAHGGANCHYPNAPYVDSPAVYNDTPDETN